MALRTLGRSRSTSVMGTGSRLVALSSADCAADLPAGELGEEPVDPSSTSGTCMSSRLTLVVRSISSLKRRETSGVVNAEGVKLGPGRQRLAQSRPHRRRSQDLWFIHAAPSWLAEEPLLRALPGAAQTQPPVGTAVQDISLGIG